MRKLLLIASALFLVQQANAQYFQHSYGNTSTSNTYEVNGQFTPVSATGTGYMIAGLHYDPTYASYNQVHVARSDDKGNIGGAPYFNYRYLLYDPNTGNPFTAWATSITEVNTGGGFEYVVVGILIYSYTPYEIDAFVLKLDAQGNPLCVNRYYFPGYAMKDPKCKMSINQKEILITGRCADVTGGTSTSQDAYVLNIDESSCVLNWGKVYDISVGTTSFDDAGVDIIENPYTSPEILVVGRSSIYGLMFKVDGSNGNPLSATIYKITGLYDEFTCIKTSGNPIVGTNDAFIIGGNTNMGTGSSPDFNMWTVLMDQNGTVAWSTDHDNGLSAGENNYCRDIIERVNTSSNYEYYAIGNIWHSGFTDQDAQVVKLDNNGLVVANGDFQYGTTTDNESGESINFSNTGGMTFSGTTSINNNDQLLVNAYFNGLTACDYNIYNFTSNSTTPSTASVTLTDYSAPKQDYLKYKINKLKDNQICYSPSVTGGNNARSAKIPGKNPFDFSIMGNGNGAVTTGSDLHVKLESQVPATQARIIDVLGREIPCRITDNGNGNLTIAAPITHTGIYYLVLSNDTEKTSKAFFVK